MLKNSRKRVEDILAEENYSEELLSPNGINETIDKNEMGMANEIYSFLNSQGTNLANSEKEQIKNKIKHSIKQLSFKRRIIRWSIAAAVLICAIFTSISYYGANNATDILRYAQTLKHITTGNKTQLILQNGQLVEIGSKQSQISYNNKGVKIVIDSKQEVIQKGTTDIEKIFNTLIVPFGKRAQITLSEGTKIWVNSGSKLVYPTSFAENKREIYLEGEAIFDIVHMDDKPFIVRTKDFDIKDIGTIFNVSVYSDDPFSSTMLEQGKIELIYPGKSFLSHETLDITPGTLAVFDHIQRNFKQSKVNPAKYTSWREGYLIFESEKLENILTKLGRYYNMEMVITDTQLKNEKFSGLLDLKNSPEEVLAIINETTSLSYTINHNKIFINPK